MDLRADDNSAFGNIHTKPLRRIFSMADIARNSRSYYSLENELYRLSRRESENNTSPINYSIHSDFFESMNTDFVQPNSENREFLSRIGSRVFSNAGRDVSFSSISRETADKLQSFEAQQTDFEDFLLHPRHDNNITDCLPTTEEKVAKNVKITRVDRPWSCIVYRILALHSHLAKRATELGDYFDEDFVCDPIVAMAVINELS